MAMDYSGHVDSTYLDMAAQILSAAKRRTYELMGLQVGHRVLDLGCGPASDTIALADLVGETGEVHGVDFDPEMVEEANVRAKAAGLDERVLHRQADAAALPFDDDFFDACRSERVFQHLPDPAAGLAEMIRVTRPGGRIVVLDTDFGSLSIASEASELERTVAEHYRSMMNSPFAGRMLYRSFKAAGLDDVSVEVAPIAVDDLSVFSRHSCSPAFSRQPRMPASSRTTRCDTSAPTSSRPRRSAASSPPSSNCWSPAASRTPPPVPDTGANAQVS